MTALQVHTSPHPSEPAAPSTGGKAPSGGEGSGVGIPPAGTAPTFDGAS